MTRIRIQCLDDPKAKAKLVGLEWWADPDGTPADGVTPHLAIAYANGRVQIMRSETDDGEGGWGIFGVGGGVGGVLLYVRCMDKRAGTSHAQDSCVRHSCSRARPPSPRGVEPVLIDTGIRATRLSWNKDGTILAVAGQGPTKRDGTPLSLVQFYTPYGFNLTILKGVSMGAREAQCCIG